MINVIMIHYIYYKIIVIQIPTGDYIIRFIKPTITAIVAVQGCVVQQGHICQNYP